MHNDRRMTHARAAAWMVGACVLWSTAGPVARLAGPCAELRRPRSGAACSRPCRWPGFSASPGAARPGRRCAPRAGPASCPARCSATMFTCFMLAVTRTTVANALIVNSLYPVFAAMLGWLVLRAKLPGYTWVAIIAAAGGMAWMFAAGLGSGCPARSSRSACRSPRRSTSSRCASGDGTSTSRRRSCWAASSRRWSCCRSRYPSRPARTTSRGSPASACSSSRCRA